MNKIAHTARPIHALLSQRWSPRAFADRPVEPAKFISLFEAARWAPSSFNEQPWHFIVAPKAEAELFDQLLGCLARGNASWAAKAPVLMLSVAQLLDEDSEPNRHAFYDVGQAVAQMALQAFDEGLYMHQMAGFDVAKAQRVFAIPEHFEPATAIALGYPGDPADLPERYREYEALPRTRKPLANFVFAGQWGQASPLVVPE